MARPASVNDLKPSRFYSVIDRARNLLGENGERLSFEKLANKLTDGGLPITWNILRSWNWSDVEGGEPLSPPNVFLLHFGTLAKEEYAKNFAREMLEVLNQNQPA